jgi:excinuclease UvrABC nuclease subunit
VQWARTVGSQGTPPVRATALPRGPGVYRFRDRAGRVLYIGRAVSLRRRVLSYWGDLGDRAHLAPMVARIAQVEAVTCDSAHELTARRDAAAAALAFEFAGRLQAELEALDWVTGEQKVTRAQDDADVCGWADGVLVWFEIRGGRLRGWRQCPCGAAAARRHLAGTPPGWADFARRNAELAARLRSSAGRS